jgi:hypothetical protein
VAVLTRGLYCIVADFVVLLSSFYALSIYTYLNLLFADCDLFSLTEASSKSSFFSSNLF